MPACRPITRPRPRPMTRRVLRVYESAPADLVEAGLAWYDNAHALAVSLDWRNPRRAAGVLAALSPRTNWQRNVAMAALAYDRGYASGGLGRSCAAANAILAGADPLDVLSGPKVRAFFTLIDNPADPHAVCIDRHAIDVAVGRRLAESDRSRWFPSRPRPYERIARCYRRAAEELGVPAAGVQAVTWLRWRDLHPPNTPASQA